MNITCQEMFLHPDLQMAGTGMVGRGMISDQNKLCRRNDIQGPGVCRKSN